LCDFIIEHAKKDTADVLKLPINVAFLVMRLCLLTELEPASLLLIMDNSEICWLYSAAWSQN